MAFGMIEFGRVVMVQQVLANSAREGARVAILDSPTPTASLVSSKVTNCLATAGISGATVTINPSEPSTAAYGTAISVSVQVPFSKVSWLPSSMFVASTTQLKACAVMRRETIQ
jgi:Flp pilus assembly protein TadG